MHQFGLTAADIARGNASELWHHSLHLLSLSSLSSSGQAPTEHSHTRRANSIDIDTGGGVEQGVNPSRPPRVARAPAGGGDHTTWRVPALANKTSGLSSKEPGSIKIHDV
eukprot:jgi/Chrzof1/4891/Cz15g03100.t1